MVFADQTAQWLEDRAAGMNYRQISAAHLERTGQKVSWQAIWARIDKALVDTVREPADHLRALELQRLDELQKAYWKNALLGDIQAAMYVLRVLESRRKLVGLDLAKNGESAVTVNVGAPTPVDLTLKDIQPLIEAAGYEVRPKEIAPAPGRATSKGDGNT